MAEFIKLIKQAALDAVAASKPTEMIYGKIESVEPISVRINQQLILTADFLVLGKHAKTKAFVVGDIVILLREQGGQNYFILDILPEPTWRPPENTVPWTSVTDKPTEYPPTLHNQSWNTITDKPSSYPPELHGHAWEEITNKPTTLVTSFNGRTGQVLPENGDYTPEMIGAAPIGEAFLTSKGSTESYTNWNDILQTGMYSNSSTSIANFPPGAGQWGLLYVYRNRPDIANQSTWIQQFYVANNPANGIYKRTGVYRSAAIGWDWTRWEHIGGDSGWVNLALLNGFTGNVKIRKIGSIVNIIAMGNYPASLAANGKLNIAVVPEGFRPPLHAVAMGAANGNEEFTALVMSTGGIEISYLRSPSAVIAANKNWLAFNITYMVAD